MLVECMVVVGFKKRRRCSSNNKQVGWVNQIKDYLEGIDLVDWWT